MEAIIKKGLPELNLFMDGPCDNVNLLNISFPDSLNEVSCNGGTGRRIGGSSDDPIESVVWNNPPTIVRRFPCWCVY